MAIADRRERERAQRSDRIVTAARTLAEAEGWDAVTTRRLADSIEYSQPVLYSHFENRDAIVAAVAVEGFAELAASLQDATTDTPSPNDALQSVARAYVAFAISNPAVYDAMFTTRQTESTESTVAAMSASSMGPINGRTVRSRRGPVSRSETRPVSRTCSISPRSAARWSIPAVERRRGTMKRSWNAAPSSGSSRMSPSTPVSAALTAGSSKNVRCRPCNSM